MSEHAKSARAAMKAKAKRMGDAGDPKAHVDASSWTPPEMVNSGAKTGMRPVSKRAFKRGGKVLHVEGEQAHQHAGRKPRNAGGKALTPNNYINRDSKEANRERSGGMAHVGGYKHGGAPKHDDVVADRALVRKMVKGAALTGKAGGGSLMSPLGQKMSRLKELKEQMLRADPRTTHPNDWVDMDRERSRLEYDLRNSYNKIEGRVPNSYNKSEGRKAGGKTEMPKRKHRADGGEIFDEQNMPMPPARRMPRPQPDMGPRYNEDAVNQAIGSSNRSGRKIKKREAAMIHALLHGRAHGGEVSSKRKHREGGGNATGKDVHTPGEIIKGDTKLFSPSDTYLSPKSETPNLKGLHDLQHKRKDGGKADHGAGCRCHKCSGGRMGKAEGGRMARATGGRANKGKTNVNIIISAGRPAVDGAAGQSGVPGGLGGPGAAPAVMPRQAPVMPAAAAPMPMPPMGGGMPMPPPQMPPPGPMGRKAGGRVYRSYKDVDAGAGSGLGRLEKTEIERRK